jgi:DNA repair protein RadC
MLNPKLHEPPPSYFKIKDLPEDDRPREKAIKHGIDTLSDSELLAILINTGTSKQSAIDIAKKLLKDFTTLQRIASLTVADLKKAIKGIGEAKAVKIIAAFELARRLKIQNAEPSKTICSPDDVAQIYIPRLQDERQELFLVVCLSSSNKIIRDRMITKGLLNSSLTHPREVFREAILENSASVILLHNHPSGNLEPSREDISITKQLVEAGKIIGIPVHDHIIIAGNSFTSMVERGLM